MNEETTLLYLETDDEVTSVVRRVRGAVAGRIVLVVPGRSRATSSVVALRLLARVAEEAQLRVSVVGDALTRSLASEAGLDAYASVDDARNAVPAAVETRGRGASIHVVRGTASDDTALVPVAAARSAAADVETRAVVVPRATASRPMPLASGRTSRRALPLAAIVGVLVALVLVIGVAGAMVLPAATIVIVPSSEPLGPVSYPIRLDDPEELSGTVEATAQVTATGTYPIQAAAAGAVVFFNFNTVDVAVGAGTLVAAGEQAFETAAEIVVPAGELTPDGRIQAGEGAVGVTAAAVGPAANVAATAIDTILTQSAAARLRGFPNNTAPLVVNPEPTVGGLDSTGPEITQQDVDAARSSLLQALDVAIADALRATGDAVFSDAAEPPEPAIEGIDGLVGTRDREAAEIRGSLEYRRLVAEPGDVTALARDRLLADAGVLPAGHEVLPDATEVTIGEATRDDDALLVSVSVTGASTPNVDRGEVIELVRGRSIEDARVALAGLGETRIELWPSWVARVPDLEWRIDIEVDSSR